jgi:hypothetical protein
MSFPIIETIREKGRGANDLDTYTKNNKYVIKITILSESSSKELQNEL